MFSFDFQSPPEPPNPQPTNFESESSLFPTKGSPQSGVCTTTRGRSNRGGKPALSFTCRENKDRKPQKHSDYFFHDGNIVLQVEDIQYKLHRSMLERQSPIFREMFTLPQPEGSTEGLVEDNPTVLSGIQAINFTRLLWFVYPPILGVCKVTTADEWMSIFEQADRWQMDGLREHAVAQLRSLHIDQITKILFWRRYNLPTSELVQSYIDIIISRPQSLSLGEAQNLGLGTFVKVAHARNLVHTKKLVLISGAVGGTWRICQTSC